MAMYGGFAAVYDMFVCPPYDEWAVYVREIWRRFGKEPALVLDLACGTGNMSSRFAAMGYETIGVDCAAEMLAAAARKNPEILYVCQDMRELDLYGTADAACCLCDGMNYLESAEELMQVLCRLRNFLNPGGVFVFDMNTEYYFAEVLGSNVFAESNDEAAYIWENEYDPDTRVNEYAVTFFAKEANGLFRRFEELHCETAFAEAEVRNAAAAAGFEVCAVYDDMQFVPSHEASERVYYILRREF